MVEQAGSIDTAKLRSVAAWMNAEADRLDAVVPPVVVPPDPEPEPEPEQPGIKQSAAFDSLAAARQNYLDRYGETWADCDPDENGQWVCYGEQVGNQSPVIAPEPEPPTTTPAVPGSANVRKLPIQQDNTWKYNTNSRDALLTIKGGDGSDRQIYAFWAGNTRLHICERAFPNGDWSEAVDIHSSVCGNLQLEWDSHNFVAVGQCPQTGLLFVTGNHHSDRLNLGISRKPGTIMGGWDKFDDKNITGDDYHGRMTYPSFNTVGIGSNERLVLSIRDQKVGGGHARFKWSIMVWDTVSRKFRNTHLNTGLSLRLYASNLARNNVDGTIHLSCIWRDETEGAGAGQWQKQDHWHMFSADGKNWKQYKPGGGTADMRLPLLWTGTSKTWRAGIDDLPPGYEPPHLIWDTSKGDPEPNSTNGQGSIVIGTDGYPHIMHSDRDTGRIWHTWYTGSAWRHEIIGDKPNSEDPIPHGSGAAMIALHSDEVRYRGLAGNDSQNTLSRGGINGGVSIVCDHGAFRRGYVSYIVATVAGNKNDQGRRNSRPTDHDSDAYAVTVPMTDLSSVKTLAIR